jgi:hypothetical protein
MSQVGADASLTETEFDARLSHARGECSAIAGTAEITGIWRGREMKVSARWARSDWLAWPGLTFSQLVPVRPFCPCQDPLLHSIPLFSSQLTTIYSRIHRRARSEIRQSRTCDPPTTTCGAGCGSVTASLSSEKQKRDQATGRGAARTAVGSNRAMVQRHPQGPVQPNRVTIERYDITRCLSS